MLSKIYHRYSVLIFPVELFSLSFGCRRKAKRETDILSSGGDSKHRTRRREVGITIFVPDYKSKWHSWQQPAFDSLEYGGCCYIHCEVNCSDGYCTCAHLLMCQSCDVIIIQFYGYYKHSFVYIINSLVDARIINFDWTFSSDHVIMMWYTMWHCVTLINLSLCNNTIVCQ